MTTYGSTVWHQWNNTNARNWDTSTTGSVWYQWNNTTSTSVTQTTWNYWCDSTNTTSASTTGSVWQTWITRSTSTGATGACLVSTEEYRRQCAQSEADRRKREREWAEEQRKKEQARKAARRRARKILVEHLSVAQRETLEKLGYFDVQVQERFFRIFNNRYQHNVFELDKEGRNIREFCAHTSHACPQEDHALAQKLMLEHALDDFCHIANVWDLSKPGRPMISRSRQPLILEA